MKPIALHDYQEYAKNFIVSHPFCALYLDMGMGKTLTTLCSLLEIKPEGHILVIAPKTIARATWTDEIDDWGIPVKTKSFIVNDRGKQLSKAERIKMYDEIYTSDPSMYFINRELLPDLVKYVETHKLFWPFPTVVIDEMQSFKSPKSERFKALRKMRPYIHRLIGLSGTPAPNGLLDLWAQLYILDRGARLGKTQTYYKNTYFDITRMYDGYPVAWEPKAHLPHMDFQSWLYAAYGMTMDAYYRLHPQHQNEVWGYYQYYCSLETPSAESEIYRRIGDICLSMKNTTVKMPQLILQDIFVTMDDDEKALYDQMRKDSILTFGDDTNAVAVNQAVLQMKLLQLASGTVYTDDTTKVDGIRPFKEIHSTKIEMCKYIVDNTNSPVIIAYHFVSDAKRLLESIDGAVLFDKTPEMIHAWNNGDIKVLLLQPRSAAHGLNLQQGPGHTLIWFTILWSLEEYLQTNARLYRQGQQNASVTIYRLFTKNTLDLYVARKLQDKNATQTDLLDAITAVLNDNII